LTGSCKEVERRKVRRDQDKEGKDSTRKRKRVGVRGGCTRTGREGGKRGEKRPQGKKGLGMARGKVGEEVVSGGGRMGNGRRKLSGSLDGADVTRSNGERERKRKKRRKERRVGGPGIRAIEKKENKNRYGEVRKGAEKNALGETIREKEGKERRRKGKLREGIGNGRRVRARGGACEWLDEKKASGEGEKEELECGQIRGKWGGGISVEKEKDWGPGGRRGKSR